MTQIEFSFSPFRDTQKIIKNVNEIFLRLQINNGIVQRTICKTSSICYWRRFIYNYYLYLVDKCNTDVRKSFATLKVEIPSENLIFFFHYDNRDRKSNFAILHQNKKKIEREPTIFASLNGNVGWISILNGPKRKFR